MELYDAIFYRKSIEFYSTKPITEFLMEEVKKFLKEKGLKLKEF